MKFEKILAQLKPAAHYLDQKVCQAWRRISSFFGYHDCLVVTVCVHEYSPHFLPVTTLKGELFFTETGKFTRHALFHEHSDDSLKLKPRVWYYNGDAIARRIGHSFWQTGCLIELEMLYSLEPNVQDNIRKTLQCYGLKNQCTHRVRIWWFPFWWRQFQWSFSEKTLLDAPQILAE